MSSHHLSSEQMEALLSDAPLAETPLHLSTCPQCSAEVAFLLAALDELRTSAIACAEHHRCKAVLAVHHHRSPRLAWTLAIAATLACIVAPLAVYHKRAIPVEITVPSEQAQAKILDEALLSSIQNDLSSSVPEPMLPLVATSTYTSITQPTGNSRKN
ncbi:hypothetical protein [Granulicella arctica]|uniref:Uncharacterized protein n=1 Tax=Granulicella arctica TaxID=940613 RepID=A0A7Y9TT35_9BACT|nr:hypothetical protein [Granulicella arctica]NYF79603.1 hypothetical protein [Granulicella arctica]